MTELEMLKAQLAVYDEGLGVDELKVIDSEVGGTLSPALVQGGIAATLVVRGLKARIAAIEKEDRESVSCFLCGKLVHPLGNPRIDGETVCIQCKGEYWKS